MPIYKLMYFNMMSLAESIRWLFAYGGVDYEDKRITLEEWRTSTIKTTMPFNQMPVLEVDGKKINQSIAISRYLAKKFGLTGKNDWENLEIDAVVDSINDLRTKVKMMWYEKVVVAKIQKQQVAEETAELVISRLDKMAKANGGYLVGGKLTWADILLFASLDSMNFRMGRDLIEKAEHLKAMREKIQALPNIKAWIEKRPKTDF